MSFLRCGEYGTACGCTDAGSDGSTTAWMWKRAPLAAVATLLPLLSGWGDAMAAEWLVEPIATLAARYDDNIGLEQGDGESTRSTTLAVGAQVRRNTEVFDMRARALTSYVDYDNLDDRDQQAADLAARYEAERHAWGLNAVLKRDTTFTVLTEDATGRTVDGVPEAPSGPDGIGEPDLPDVGVSEVQVRRNRLTLRPRWEYDLTQRTSIGVDYRFIDVSYEDDVETDLTDHRTHAVEGRLAYRLAPNETLIGSVEAARFRADEIDVETDNVSLLGGYERAFTPVTRATFTLGLRRSEVSDGGADDSSNGVIVRAGIARTLRAGRLSAEVGRDVRPSGLGEMVESDYLDFLFERDLTPRLTFFAGGLAFNLRSVRDEELERVERRYYRVEPGLRYELTRWTSIGASYRYRWQDRETDAESAESNAFLVSLEYLGRL